MSLRTAELCAKLAASLGVDDRHRLALAEGRPRSLSRLGDQRGAAWISRRWEGLPTVAIVSTIGRTCRAVIVGPKLLVRCLLLATLAAALAGCCCRRSATVYDPNYGQLVHDMCDAEVHPLPPVEAISPVIDALAGPHSVDDYVRVALATNPNVQAAQKKVEAAAYRVPQAASLDDPDVSAEGWPFFPNVPQTASGRMTADVNVSQKIPWYGKLRTKADAAESELNMSR